MTNLQPRSAVFCYAPQDAPIAHQLGAYLERNTPIQAFYDEGLVTSGDDLIDAVGRGLSAELVFVLLSPEAVPSRWERDQWAPVFIDQPREFGSALFFVLARECKFPDLLRRRGFADLTQDVVEGMRELKRQLFRKNAWFQNPADLPANSGTVTAVEHLRRKLADGPGEITNVDRNQALAFAHACQAEFEGVFWIDCARRTPAGVLGDTAQALGLKLTGASEQNHDALRRVCNDRRCLFIYEHLSDPISFGGRSSVIGVAPYAADPVLPIEETMKLFSAWTARREECLRHLGDAQEHLRHARWNEAHRLGVAVFGLLKNEQRLAEANEILETLIEAARAHDDEEAYRRFTWDQSWILGHWGEPYVFRAIPLEPERAGSQLGFAFS